MTPHHEVVGITTGAVRVPDLNPVDAADLDPRSEGGPIQSHHQRGGRKVGMPSQTLSWGGHRD
jgi:hypothetical protein